mmetsp:Transcript_55074/g.133805  ORF Transcript_55074/g.133805 Transcript_55074/m.133805 type:complete len:500 (-) Transcript_55074:825-2324(-)
MASNGTVQCHYDVLRVERDADSSSIKKSYRKLAIQYHPDKNVSKTDDEIKDAADQFRRIQQAYEVLSDPQERRWYDEHRQAILSGWTSGSAGADGGDGDLASRMLFQVGPFMSTACFTSFDDNDKKSFWNVYTQVFEGIVLCEMNQSDTTIELPTRFGTSDTPWEDVKYFYQSWESFSSALNFAWEDTYNANEDGQNRWVRRRMEEENRKARKSGRKEYNNDILTLVAFVKRRDPRVKAKQKEIEQQKAANEAKRRQDAIDRKKEQKEAKEKWKEEAQRELEAAAEQDRLAGRVRLADLDDDYDYGGGGKKSKKKKGKGKNRKRNGGGSSFNDDDPQSDSKLNVDGQKTDLNDALDPDGDGDEMVKDSSDCDQDDDPDMSKKIDEPEPSFQKDVQDQEDIDDGDVPKSSQDLDGNYDDFGAQDEYLDEDDDDDEESSEDEPDVWRCDCCRKDFKSEAQMENHLKSKKHKEAYKKFMKKVKEKEEELMAEMMDEMDLTTG